jgi:hypothetical protein
MQSDGDEWVGKSAGAVKAWFKTLGAMFANRRMLLSKNESATSPYVSPLTYLLGIVGVSLVINHAIGAAPPPTELPHAAQALLTASSVFYDSNSLYYIALAALAALVYWAFFRVSPMPLRFRVVLRHAAYNLGSILFVSTALSVIGAVWRFTAPPVPPAVITVGAVLYGIAYVWLWIVALGQVTDEAGTRAWKAAIPFVLAFVTFWVLLPRLEQQGPDMWATAGPNMAPSVQAGDTIHIDKWILLAREPRVGDVMVAKPGDHGTASLPVIGVLATGRTTARRVLALPGDAVAEDGPDFVINAEKVPLTVMSKHQAHDKDMMPMRAEIDDSRFVVQYGPKKAPLPCLPPGTTILAKGRYLLAFDTRRDGSSFCSIVDRARIIGIVDWDGRSDSKP